MLMVVACIPLMRASVIISIDIPESIEGSLYDSQVCIILFFFFSPHHLGTELNSWLTTEIGESLSTEGGPDHQVT